jgi:HSP20 family protein
MSVTTRRLTSGPVLGDFLRLSNRLGPLMNDGLGNSDWQLRDGATASWVPPVDIFERGDAIRIVAEIPGGSRADVKSSLEDNVLMIHGS